ncbi:FAD-binding oxidoreductase [Pseudonocardia sp. KRD-184]|uniref:FAD-binding oxidoreductase n=1 Tax=Pseudonocardia oceani TaxID=2792013 RepID=A0ABS6UBR3_9PSEU|nr:FAD-binding oxidoreductase [Pseudonocardia oceani]MBW0094218.1 FAD-binding oxidoreductase [Pseudonocardia oceani]MBW0098239.1 FAD-binding oxidoreductase [Pseudonocardia oceani]MBW0113271.1 FAD-binding oxidoreductase [Pseudonocardia oceani]MBW0124858.1 FAD-binding oxidoreductase [Pseudonocardia oceani]MBW0129683.1 FAD-binding oxidoreductase [Pseudonocardia oceani]
MTQTVSGDLALLRSAVAGAVTGPDDPGYDEARTVWNADVDRRPAAIVRVTGDADVSAAVRFAVESGLELAVRGGAHGASGPAVCDGGLTIDLRDLEAVAVDPVAHTARVGGGATLAQLDAATAVFGLATVAGTVGHTGVGGYTLGGGMGWLTPRFGLAVDNLLAVRIVTADGRVRRASAEQNADLFWAVRGGGGNFGVVTEFTFRLHELDPLVQVAAFFWPQSRAAEALRLADHVMSDVAPDGNALVAMVHAPPAPFVPPELQGTPVVGIVLAGFDRARLHTDMVDRIRAALPPAFELVTPMPYVALQQMFDEGAAFGHAAYERSTFLPRLSDGAIDALVEHTATADPLAQVVLMRLDRAYCEVAEEDTAFGGARTPRVMAFLVGVAADSAGPAPVRARIRALSAALEPHSLGRGTYVNALAGAEHDRVRASYGPKYARLARIKGEWDPQNVFHRNANISPAG